MVVNFSNPKSKRKKKKKSKRKSLAVVDLGVYYCSVRECFSVFVFFSFLFANRKNDNYQAGLLNTLFWFRRVDDEC